MNLVILTGWIADDPKDRTTSQGKRVVSARIKTSERFGDKTYDNYHSLVMWDEKADLLHRCKDGEEVIIVGKLKTRKHNDKYYTEVNVSHVGVTPTGGGSTEGADTGDDCPF